MKLNTIDDFLVDNLFGKDYNKFFVGFNNDLQKINNLQREIAKNVNGYPPYNISKTGENSYLIEVAVAGFAKQDIEIELENNKLVIKGNSQTQTPDTDYLFRGIAARNFSRTFAIGDQLEIKNAELVNGMLKVFLEAIIPEHKKSKRIDIR